MTKHTLISALGATFCVLLLAGTASAQDDPGSTGPAPAILPPATPVPLDGGASLLLAGGVAYGLKRLRERRSKK